MAIANQTQPPQHLHHFVIPRITMSTTYTVTINHNGATSTVQVPADQTILQVALDSGIELPSSCLAGVCTTCAAKVVSGTVEQPDAMGVSSELQAEGYVLLCTAYPRSDVTVEAGKEDELYDRQFGQPS
jgi:ferredoxin